MGFYEIWQTVFNILALCSFWYCGFATGYIFAEKKVRKEHTIKPEKEYKINFIDVEELEDE